MDVAAADMSNIFTLAVCLSLLSADCRCHFVVLSTIIYFFVSVLSASVTKSCSYFCGSYLLGLFPEITGSRMLIDDSPWIHTSYNTTQTLALFPLDMMPK